MAVTGTVLTAKQHAANGCCSRTEPDEGAWLGVLNRIQAVHALDVFDHLYVALFELHILAVVALDGSHVDARVLGLELKMTSGVQWRESVQRKDAVGN